MYEFYDSTIGARIFHLVEQAEKDPGRWAEIVVSDFSPGQADLNIPVKFYFGRSGQEAIVNEVMQAVVDICGPLVLLRDFEKPEIFYPSGSEID